MESHERRAAIERDDFECQHCGTIDVIADDGGLETHVVGPATPESATRHFLVTVCAECADWLEGDPLADRTLTEADLFRAVRELTRVQAAVVSDVADLAAATSSFPDDPEGGVDRTYAADRRTLSLTLDLVDARLEAVAELDPSNDDNDADVDAALEAFVTEADALQSQLRTVVGTVSVAASALERCYVCFEPLDGEERCSRCGADRLDVSELREADGSIEFDALRLVIGDALEETSRRTDGVLERTTALADRLVG